VMRLMLKHNFSIDIGGENAEICFLFVIGGEDAETCFVFVYGDRVAVWLCRPVAGLFLRRVCLMGFLGLGCLLL